LPIRGQRAVQVQGLLRRARLSRHSPDRRIITITADQAVSFLQAAVFSMVYHRMRSTNRW
jgi:hypothetical protein